jgi:hypothetical protein
VKVITLLDPWATLVSLLEKGYETRKWRTKYRGPIAIHVSASIRPWHMDLSFKEPFRTALASTFTPDGKGRRLQLGKIIAVANLVEIVPTQEIAPKLSAKELAFGDFSPGRWAWRLDDLHQIVTPVPAKGKLGLWEIDDRLIGEVLNDGRCD